MENKKYKEFVKKFEHKKTTDDCYTHPLVYEAIKGWVVNEYKLEGKEIYRPFYPGGDYEKFDYKGGVVIDNPPFSILKKIIKFYDKNNIKYFLFAPNLTMFSSNVSGYIITDTTITYENGAKVNTGFISNMEPAHLRTAPGLKKLIEEADKEGYGKNKNKLPKYAYPDNLVRSSTLNANIEFSINKDQCHFVRRLDSQIESKKTIFGAGFLISDKKAKELQEKTKAEGSKSFKRWELSAREKEIIKKLNKN